MLDWVERVLTFVSHRELKRVLSEANTLVEKGVISRFIGATQNADAIANMKQQIAAARRKYQVHTLHIPST